MKNEVDEKTYKELAKRAKADAEMRSAGCTITDYEAYKAYQRNEVWSAVGWYLLLAFAYFAAGALFAFIKLAEAGFIGGK